METKTKEKNSKTNGKKQTATAKKPTPKATEKKETTSAKEAEKTEAVKKVAEILNPTAEQRIQRLEVFQQLGERKKRIDSKADELAKFRAGNDNVSQKMEFTTDCGYRFTISHNGTIEKLLNVIEDDLHTLKERTDAEVQEFQI
ncbi:hypothetical protein [Altibacter sp. HG106]|uniref:hypothetical protein n=1 Tax=Altibacter sp. HG106 TaxID=3023937 RepID=UPI002350E404|nr:hypothetical protein [Altibacter sp. HG106]MDC7994468.1 hypothetical protein [Altibacter sp. HG106]